MPPLPAKAACRRYSWRIAVAMSAYMFVLFATRWWFHHDPKPGPINYVFALLPALPIIGIIVILGLYLHEETDEFIRMRHTQALLVASGLTLSVTTAWGFIEMATPAPHMNAFWAFPIFCMAWLATGFVIKWRDR